MIDGIKSFCRSSDAYDQLLLNNKQGLVFSGAVETGDVSKYEGKYAGLYVDVFESTKECLQPGIYLHGSLHRYLKGHNDGLFTFQDLKDAVNRLGVDFYVDPSQCDLQNVEIGVNIGTNCPEAFINSAMLYHGRTGIRIPGKKYFGKSWDFSQYSVKLYKKESQKVRYEIKIREMAKVGDIQLNTISDLCDITKYVKLLFVLIKSIDEFLFVPADREHSLPDKVSAEWGTYRAESYWEGLSKDKKYRTCRKIKALIKEYNLINWCNFLRKETIKEGCKMLGTSQEKLAAMFSALGLHTQTVAVPDRYRDRQAAEIIMKTIPAKRYLMARDIGYPFGVIILTLSYYPLVARGPPSSCLYMRIALPYLYRWWKVYP